MKRACVVGGAAFDPLAFVSAVWAVEATAAGGAGAAPDAFGRAVSVPVAAVGTVEAAASIRGGAAELAAALVAQMLVMLVRAVQAARPEGRGVTKTTFAHLVCWLWVGAVRSWSCNLWVAQFLLRLSRSSKSSANSWTLNLGLQWSLERAQAVA